MVVVGGGGLIFIMFCMFPVYVLTQTIAGFSLIITDRAFKLSFSKRQDVDFVLPLTQEQKE